MNENVNDDQQKLFNADKAQLKALMQVINQISNRNVPLRDPSELVTNKNIRNLQNWASEYTFDDGDLVQDLKSAIIELQYLLAVIKDLREQVKHLQSENARLERLAANAI
jgi:hypothetical protein